MVDDIVVVGAGGHCRVVLSILQYYEQYNVIGIADKDLENKGEEILGTVIQFSVKDLRNLYREGINNAVVAIGDNNERKVLFNELSDIGFNLPTIIHPSALIENSVVLGGGSVICMGVELGALVNIGRNCIIYTGSIIEHETKLGENVFIAPGCNIAGRVTIHDDCFIGIGSTIKEKITIGEKAVIGAGSVVIKDVLPNDKVAGVPAKSIK